LIGKVNLIIGMVKIVGEIGRGRIVWAPREIQVISPTRIVSPRVGIVLRPRVGHVHAFRRYLMSLKNGTLFKNMIWCLTI